MLGILAKWERQVSSLYLVFYFSPASHHEHSFKSVYQNNIWGNKKEQIIF